MEENNLKIAILGTAPSWVDAPFSKVQVGGMKGPDDWEIWVPNRSGLKMKPWDRLFEIHQNWDYGSPEARKAYLSNLKEIKPPQKVVSITPLDCPANVVIDREDYFRRYGSIWFSSTFGYMMAVALDEKPTDIGFWGVDMESHEEYVVQFAGLRHFIDLAKDRGIKIHVSNRSSLMREPKAYADRFETVFALKIEEDARRLQKQTEEKEDAVLLLRDIVAQEEGQFQICKKYDRWSEANDLQVEIVTDRARLRRLEASWNRAKGALFTIQHYKRLFVWNVTPPPLGKETDLDIEDSGPI